MIRGILIVRFRDIRGVMIDTASCKGGRRIAMREQSRVFGNNLQLYMKEAGIGVKEFAKKLNYSEYEVQRMMDARLIPDNGERKEIAEMLGVSVETLYKKLDDKAYEQAGCLECRGRFSTAANKREILDLFDAYCDVQETLREEGLKSSV